MPTPEPANFHAAVTVRHNEALFRIVCTFSKDQARRAQTLDRNDSLSSAVLTLRIVLA
jgi:hypothetical protein